MAHKTALPVNTTELCAYGCNQKAKFKLRSGKLICESSYNKCPYLKSKNSEGLKEAYKEGRKNTKQFDGKRGWAKGLTKETHNSIMRLSETLKQLHNEGILNNSRPHTEETKRYLSKKELNT